MNYDPKRCAELEKQLGTEPLSGKSMKTAKEFNLLAESLAHLSFVPSGCRAFGLHFEAQERTESPIVAMQRLDKTDVLEDEESEN